MDTSDRPIDPLTGLPADIPADVPIDPGQPVAVVPVVAYEPAFEQVTYAQPEPPRKPAGPPKSVTGAALLNLTGLGLGYAYLRNHVLLAVALVVTAGIVTVAFLTDAAAQPWVWRGAVLGWVVLVAAHAALLASRREPGARQRGPVVAGVVAVAVVAAGYVGYGIAGAAVYDRGVTAQEAGDCGTAGRAFATVTGPFELTLSADVLAARTRSVECAAYEKARAAQDRDDYESAIVLYDDFGKIHPDSVLAPHVHTNLADTHFAKATSWQEPVTDVDARLSVDTLLMLRRDFADTGVADKAPAAIADMFAAATKPYGTGKFCDSLTVLAYFADLDPSSAGEKVVADANTFRARSLFECGLSQYRAGRLSEAVTSFTTFLAKYPDDGRAPQVNAARVSAAVAVANKVTLPMPPPLGGNDPGSIPMTFYNDSQEPLKLLVAGPTAHEVTVAACELCPESYAKDDPAACADVNGRPSVTLHLTPATYYFTTETQDWVEQVSGSFTPKAGWEQWQCVYTSPA
ncbi:tetratricopeptide repeat protein [Actinophytocola algeriensis]|uniref:TolA-binding protein n=1 Tax=Actinophytocola algeriensis TaxID=1768010 RepID=A0A7W7VEP9_9PSEU|nr:tetratricopeptide repeat protein [Actinophytocola algeriensis]MBB4907467.1 TolA-binding protein [Actinophytocola algeriensis]MBE1479497.1 TolA-binding protein [Actinophytocola algeriensis]